MDAPLIWHIEKYLRKTGMRASNFGREAAKDPRLVFDLRRGREPGRRIVRKVQDYMEERGSDPVIKPAAQTSSVKRRRAARRPIDLLLPERVDAGRALRVALKAVLGEAHMIAQRERPWASATFVGARHYWTWAITGPDHANRAQAFELALPELEFSVRGHLVADAVVTDRRSEMRDDGQAATIVTVEILCVEDA